MSGGAAVAAVDLGATSGRVILGHVGPDELLVATLTEYQAPDELPVRVAFPPVVVDSLAAYLSRLGLRQLHLAGADQQRARRGGHFLVGFADRCGLGFFHGGPEMRQVKIG